LTRLALTLFLLLSLLPCLTADKSVDRAKARFLNWDINRDGKLHLQELPPFAKKNFQRVDQNKDGSISLSEHLGFLSKQKNNSNKKEFRVLSNLPYANTPNPRQTLNLVLPAQISANKKLPLIVWIHGGGWKNGDKQSGLSPRLSRKSVD